MFDRFELEDKSYLNYFDRYIEHSELTESSPDERAVSKSESVEDIVYCRICNERLYYAIAALPQKQSRRLVLHYFYNLTYEQIAMLEGCAPMPVKRSIDRAVKKLRQYRTKSAVEKFIKKVVK